MTVSLNWRSLRGKIRHGDFALCEKVTDRMDATRWEEDHGDHIDLPEYDLWQ